MIDTKPEAVKAFVEATRRGLACTICTAIRRPANALIKKTIRR